MIICVCKNISDRDIARAVSEGCRSFKAVQNELELGKSCGTCLDCARECFAESKAANSGARSSEFSPA
ncbi:MAG: (2Fe-2S)-binding protein [Proteobacteria bacterium]|jgi:bacterioferritin-associated ferredoxin|nr:(2Fe-2S)-binding protein [Pseudomonadota bacterium]MBK7116541.1 (2Fe-2S)-binding protein [Pseudomonadota bacterium]MBK9252952.1 (2Fe-2S)-binding protein [Pseudomonadota bacterium]MCC6631234.1 (2Fe-2S)-binding protein [Gammaproteobacteria bacterium]